MQQDSYYPPVGFYFRVNVLGISGTNEGSFQEVSGLNFKFGVKDVEEGGENRFVHKFPIPAKYDNLVLKRGMLLGSPLINWARACIEQFTFVPTIVMVYLMDETSVPISAWMFVNAYPIGIKYSDLKAQENSIVVETLELCYDYFNKIF
jgi:phage tail-like protein